MHHDDFKLELRIWVLGALVMWNMQMKAFADINSMNFASFCDRTFTTVYRYITNEIGLDGSCSDLECDLALRAERIFNKV